MNINDKSYPLLADLFLLFSNSAPWLILYSLRQKAMTLSEISKSLGMTQKAVLPELMALQKKDILYSYIRSHKTFYRLTDVRILKAFDLIQTAADKKAQQAEKQKLACEHARILQKGTIWQSNGSTPMLRILAAKRRD